MNSIGEWLAWLGVGDAETALGSFFLVAARIAPLAVLAPWIAVRSAPLVVRGALVMALTAALAPLALAGPVIDATGGQWGVLLLREALIGTLFAFAAALPFYALDWAGRATDAWRGQAHPQVQAIGDGGGSAMGQLYLFAGVVLFLSVGGHRMALVAFADSLAIAPIGQITVAQTSAEVALGAARLAGSALAFAAAIAAPAAVCIVAVEVSVGLLSRTTPQLPAFFAAMPLRAATGLAAAALGLAVVVDQLPAAFQEGLDNARALIRILVG